jgi:hypothetical protein
MMWGGTSSSIRPAIRQLPKFKGFSVTICLGRTMWRDRDLRIISNCKEINR